MRTRLVLQGLSVRVAGKRVVDEASAKVSGGEIVGITGSNGSGKSSLAMTILGSEEYEIVEGSIKYEGKELGGMRIEERARSGILVAWQNPVTLTGVSVFSLCRAAYEAVWGPVESLVKFKKQVEMTLERVGLTAEYVGRGVNEGFSGGEKKRLELLQILLLKPKLVVLDEIDSGLDVSGRKLLLEIIKELQQQETTVIVISHYEQLLKELKVTQKWVMQNGKLQTGI